MGTPLTRALVAAYLEYALTHLGWVPRPGYPFAEWVTPPCNWTFLSSLGRSESISDLLKVLSSHLQLAVTIRKHERSAYSNRSANFSSLANCRSCSTRAAFNGMPRASRSCIL